MNVLLIFFAIPLATIILSAILETFVNCPIKVAGIFFSIFIVLAFVFGGTAELIVAAIIYTVISFITAIIIRFIINRQCNRCNDNCNECNNCSTCRNNNFVPNTLAFNNNLNRLGTTTFGLNTEVTSNNVLQDDSITNFNSNNNGNFCRRCR